MTTVAASVRRRRYLGTYFDELAAFARNPGQNSRPASIPIGTLSLPVESWEWEGLLAWARSSREDGWQCLLAEGLALEARCTADMARAGAGAPTATAEGLEAACSDLQFDAVLGFKLMEEIQRAVEKMIIQGRMDQAKKLTQFRHRINEGASAIGKFIGEAALREAETLASAAHEVSPTTNARQEDAYDEAISGANLEALLDLEERLRKKAEQDEARVMEGSARKMVAVEPEPELESRVSWRLVLVSMLAVLTLVWFFVVAWPAKTRVALRAFTAADFATLPAIHDVMARPPSLFVTLDEEQWRALSDDARREMIDKVAQRIEPAGYTGAEFSGTIGGTLAQWLKLGGVRLNDPGKPAS